MRIFSKLKSSASTILLVMVAVFCFLGLNHFVLHWQLPFSSSMKTSVAQAGPAKITKIEPIVLDCRARISAEVPVNGKRSHQLHLPFGKRLTTQTDTMKMDAIGDVETCVHNGAMIDELKGGGWKVTIPSQSIVFNRPRVDTIKTAKSVHFKKGWFGKLTDVFPWVSEDNGLVPDAYAYAQTVIGGSSCMKAAWQPTQQVIQLAYQQQAVAKRIDPKKVTVVFDGTPNFNQNDLSAKKVHGMTFLADAKHAVCKVNTNALQTGK